jgi:hypothetical protein
MYVATETKLRRSAALVPCSKDLASVDAPEGRTTGATGAAARDALDTVERFSLSLRLGLRYTFTDLVRRANVDAVVRRALTGRVTEEMQRHYSMVGIDEKRAAIAGVLRLVPPTAPTADGNAGGTSGGTTTEKAG